MRIITFLLTIWIAITGCSPRKGPEPSRGISSLGNETVNAEVLKATYRKHGKTNMISYQVYNKEKHAVALNIWGWFVQRNLDSCLQSTVGPSHRTFLHNEITFLSQPAFGSISDLRAYTSGWLPPEFALVESEDTVNINISWIGEPIKVPETYWLRVSLPVWNVADAKKATGAEFRSARSINLDVEIGPRDTSVKCVFSLNSYRSYTLNNDSKELAKYDKLKEGVRGRAEAYRLHDWKIRPR